ncbi:hypothetical protein ACERIM_04680 [Natrinema sp. H-ect1]|uniref:hypothetical protein n=1 Tax=Natrinema sp. H-ect1 TaxID=3242700 RepID=UPI00359E5315
MKFGVVLIIIGSLVSLGPIYGVDSLLADRVTQVDVADDERTAILGLEDVYSGPRIESGGWFSGDVSADAVRITNNANGPFDLEATVTGVRWDGKRDSRVLAIANGADLDGGLAPNEQRTVELECSGDVTTGSATGDVLLTVSATGSDVSVHREDFLISNVDFDCDGDSTPGDGDPADDPTPIGDTDLELVGQPSASPSSGIDTGENSRVTFDLENTGSESVTVTGISVDDQGSDATMISYWGSGDEVVIATANQGRLSVDDSLSVGETAPRYALDENAVFEQGERASVTLEQFRTDGWPINPQAEMSGETVTVILYTEGLDPNDPTAETAVEVELPLE